MFLRCLDIQESFPVGQSSLLRCKPAVPSPPWRLPTPSQLQHVRYQVALDVCLNGTGPPTLFSTPFLCSRVPSRSPPERPRSHLVRSHRSTARASTAPQVSPPTAPPSAPCRPTACSCRTSDRDRAPTSCRGSVVTTWPRRCVPPSALAGFASCARPARSLHPCWGGSCSRLPAP